MLRSVGLTESAAQPIGNRLWDYKASELTGQLLLGSVTLRALPAVTRAVIIDIPALFEFPHHQTPAVAAMNQTGVGEIMLHLTRFVFSASIQQPLNALPEFTGDERLVRAGTSGAVPIEITAVQAPSKDLMQRASVEFEAAQLNALGVQLGCELFNRAVAACESLKYEGDDRRCLRVRQNDSFGVRPIGVVVAGGGTRIDAGPGLFRHPFDRFLAEVLAVVSRHKDLYPMHELLV
jgi:hypothetical protein